MLPAYGPAGYIGCLLLYYITDSHHYGEGPERFGRLLDRIAAAAHAGVDSIQLREKDLSGRELESLARGAMQRIRAAGSRTKLLINSRSDVAIAAGADGVHLPASDISPTDARRIFTAVGFTRPTIAVSCHTQDEVRRAHEEGADFVVFGPVFQKSGKPGVGFEALQDACAGVPIPVLALGGVDAKNARACLEHGAKGVAGIRLFQTGDIRQTVTQLRS
jgi:thiamine-phosphate pyrophosphorylase